MILTNLILVKHLSTNLVRLKINILKSFHQSLFDTVENCLLIYKYNFFLFLCFQVGNANHLEIKNENA